MTHNHGHGGTFGAIALIAAIAFAFGPRVARIVVGTALIAVLVFFVAVLIWI